MLDDLGGLLSVIFEYLPPQAFLELATCSSAAFLRSRNAGVYFPVVMLSIMKQPNLRRFQNLIIGPVTNSQLPEHLMELKNYQGRIELRAANIFYDLQEANLIHAVRVVVCGVTQTLSEVSFPHLESLHLPPQFDDANALNLLPKGLKKLVFGSAFNQPLRPGILPKSLEEIVFGARFDQQLLPGVLPPHLRRLELGNHYNEAIHSDWLPAGLRELEIGRRFHHELTESIAGSEVSVLPPGLKKLTIGFGMEMISPHAIPDSVKSLTLLGVSNMRFRSDSHPHLKHLKLAMVGGGMYHEGELPVSLQSLEMGHPGTPILRHLIHLTRLTITFFRPDRIPLDEMPDSLQSLTVGYKGDDQFDEITMLPGLDRIWLDSQTGIFPPKLTELAIQFACSDTKLSWLRTSFLRSVRFESGLVASSLAFLPSSLETLSIHSRFTSPILPGDLPPFLEVLEVGIDFNHSLGPGVLPNTLRWLRLPDRYQHASTLHLPPTLRHLQLPIGPGESLPPQLNRENLRHLIIVYRNGARSIGTEHLPIACRVQQIYEV